MLAECAMLIKSKVTTVFFFRKYDIIRFYETWQRHEQAFDSFSDGYTNFDCMRAPRSTTQRGSGGVTVFCEIFLVNNNIILCVLTDMSECVLLLIDSIFNDGIHDIVLIFTYVEPEKSPIYSPENDDGIIIVILIEKIFTIKSGYPEAEIFLEGDINLKTKYFWTIYQMMTLT